MSVANMRMCNPMKEYTPHFLYFQIATAEPNAARLAAAIKHSANGPRAGMDVTAGGCSWCIAAPIIVPITPSG